MVDNCRQCLAGPSGQVQSIRTEGAKFGIHTQGVSVVVKDKEQNIS